MSGFSDPPSGFSGSHDDLQDVSKDDHRTDEEIQEQALAFYIIGV